MEKVHVSWTRSPASLLGARGGFPADDWPSNEDHTELEAKEYTAQFPRGRCARDWGWKIVVEICIYVFIQFHGWRGDDVASHVAHLGGVQECLRHWNPGVTVIDYSISPHCVFICLYNYNYSSFH